MLVNMLIFFGIRKGEELKTPRYASAAATRDYITARDIIPTLATLLLWLPSIYKYCLTIVTNMDPPYLLLPLQYKSFCPKIYLLVYGAFLLRGYR